MKNRPCPLCKKGTLKRGTARHEIPVGKIRFVGELPIEQCNACDEPIVRSEDLGGFELAIAEQLTVLGLRAGPAFKFMRKVMGIRAVDLAKLLGVAAETVSRWETGKPDPLAFSLLGAMVADRIAGKDDTVKRLQALRAAPSKRKVFHVKLDPLVAKRKRVA